MESSPLNSVPILRDVGKSNMFATVHNTRFMSPILEPRELAINALLQDWQGNLMSMFQVPPAQPIHSESKDHPGGRSDTNNTLVAIKLWFPHLLRLCVTTLSSFRNRWDLLSQQGYVSDGKSYCLHAWRLSFSTTKQQDFQKRSLDSQQLLEAAAPRKPSTNRMFGGFASLTGLQDKKSIRLVPQLLNSCLFVLSL